MKRNKDMAKFVKGVKEEMKRDNSYYGAFCCQDCAMTAASYLVENYPTYLTTIEGKKDGTFRVACWKMHTKEAEE